MTLDLIELLDDTLNIHGYEITTAKMEGPNLYLIRIEEKKVEPSPLGIHITDNAAAKERLGDGN
jgi:hypothetical protein